MNARFFKSLVSIRKYFNCLQSCYKVERVPAKPLALQTSATTLQQMRHRKLSARNPPGVL